MISFVNNLLGTLTFLADIALLLFLLLLLVRVFFKINYVDRITKFIHPNAYIMSFIVSLVAMLGSLFFSEIAHYTPCLLCWYQRIAMYPQSFLMYIAILRNERVLTPYLLVINAIGASIAIYHYVIQRLPTLEFFNCTAGGQAACTKDYFLQYGYITIPVMALTAFLLNVVLLSMSKATTQSRNNNRHSNKKNIIN